MAYKLLIDFERVGDTKFHARAHTIVTKLTSEPALTRIPDPWPDSFPSRAELQSAFTEYRDAWMAAQNDGRKTDRQLRDEKRAVLTNLLKKLAPYLESVAEKEKSEGILIITGYDQRQPIIRHRTNGEMPAPDLKVKHSVYSGAFEGRVERIPGAGSYEGQIANGDGEFKTVVVSKRATRIEFPGLIPGQRYQVRMRAIGSHGPGPWSNVVSLIAL